MPSIDAEWHGLYRVGGLCLLATGVIFMAGAIAGQVMGPPPADADAYLNALAARPRLALALYALFALTDVLLVPATMALYLTLRQTARGAMAVAMGLIALYVFVDLAVTETDSLALVALARHLGGAERAAAYFALAILPAATFFSYFISSVGFLIVSVLMLRGPYRRVAAYAGIVACVEGIVGAFYVVYPPLAILLPPCLVAFGLWGVLSGARLWKVGAGESAAALSPAESYGNAAGLALPK
jgi:hypothetical protein